MIETGQTCHYAIDLDLCQSAESDSELQSFYVIESGFSNKAKWHRNSARQRNETWGFLFCLDGTGSVVLNGKHWNIRGGDAVLYGPDTIHALQPDEEDPWSLYWFHAMGDGCAAVFERGGMTQEQPVRWNCADHWVPNLLHGLNSAMHRCTSIGGMNECSFLARQALLHSRSHEDDETDFEQWVGIKLAMKDNHGKIRNAEDLSNATQLNTSELNRLCRLYGGRSPKQFINRQRINKSAFLLASTSEPINEISHRVGFDDPLYFSRYFRKFMGMPPSEYREQTHNGSSSARLPVLFSSSSEY